MLEFFIGGAYLVKWKIFKIISVVMIVMLCFFSKSTAKELFFNVNVDGFYVSASISEKIESKKIKVWSNVFLVPDVFKYAKTGTSALEKISVLSCIKNKKLKNNYYKNCLEKALKNFPKIKIKYGDSEIKILKNNFYILNLALKSIII